MQTNSYKYVTASEEDKSWGLYLNVAGKATINKNSLYPPRQHPSEYYFNLENGRVLQEYQIIYVTEGKGVFECQHGKFRIEPGSLIILFPGEWHKYRPLKSTGWKEHYIGFNGSFVNEYLKNDFFKKENPIIKLGYQNELLNLFYLIHENIINEKAGYQQVCSGLAIAYIGKIISILKNKDFEGKEIEKKIQKACFIIREKLSQNINAEELADELNIGYSYFRKMFFKYTGISPLQYHLQLRIKKAEDLLINSSKSIKEIAFELGFNSLFYFSRLFKSKTSLTPTELRAKAKKITN